MLSHIRKNCFFTSLLFLYNIISLFQCSHIFNIVSITRHPNLNSKQFTLWTMNKVTHSQLGITDYHEIKDASYSLSL